MSSTTTSDGSHSGGSLLDGGQEQRHLSSSLQSALLPLPAPLPPADSVQRVQGREAHFYRFVSSCTDAAVLFEVCLEDPGNGVKKRFVCILLGKLTSTAILVSSVIILVFFCYY